MEYKEHIRKKDGGLQAILSYKEGRKWKQKSKQGFEDNKKGEKQAKKWMHDTLNELEKNIKLNKEYNNLTFLQFYELYKNDRKIVVTDATLNSIDSMHEKFKSLDELYVKDITPIDIQRCVNLMSAEGLSSSSIYCYLSKLKALFNKAIKKYNMISFNPIRDIEYPKNKPKEKKALTTKESNELLKKVKTEKNKELYIATLLALKCGLRIGEIAGLTWNDIDFNNKILKINKQWRTKNGEYTFTKLKTANSYRNVFFNNFVKKELLEFKNVSPINIDFRILTYKTTALSVALARKYRKHGFDISVHELRHTYATNIISNGIDFKTAAHLLGHDVEQTMKTYSHVNEDMLNTAREIINNYL